MLFTVPPHPSLFLSLVAVFSTLKWDLHTQFPLTNLAWSDLRTERAAFHDKLKQKSPEEHLWMNISETCQNLGFLKGLRLLVPPWKIAAKCLWWPFLNSKMAAKPRPGWCVLSKLLLGHGRVLQNIFLVTLFISNQVPSFLLGLLILLRWVDGCFLTAK